MNKIDKRTLIEKEFDELFRREPEGRERTRMLVRKRDNFTCQRCGKKWSLYMRHFDVHHLNGMCGKKSRGYDRVKDMNGLITLCHKCHLSLPHVREKISNGLLRENKNLKERNEKIIELRKSGLSFRKIGFKFSISGQAVFLVVKNNSLS